MVIDVAVGIALLRLIIQLFAARVHVRRARRAAERPLRCLGPVSLIVPAYNEAANIAATLPVISVHVAKPVG